MNMSSSSNIFNYGVNTHQQIQDFWANFPTHEVEEHPMPDFYNAESPQAVEIEQEYQYPEYTEYDQ